jgi:RNA polymerase sigma-70 factor (ECF subfamily)
MGETPMTRLSLLVRLRDPRDTDAWEEFVAIYGPLVQRLARQKGLQEADASDVSQEVFQAVARAIDSYDPDRGSFRGWLFRVARNATVNHLIRLSRHPQGSGNSGVNSILEAQPAPAAEESALFDAEYRRQLLYWAAERIRGEFSELTWNAFWRTGVEGRNPKDVAKALDTTVGTVYHCKSRVMARLRKEIERLDDESTISHG